VANKLAPFLFASALAASASLRAQEPAQSTAQEPSATLGLKTQESSPPPLSKASGTHLDELIRLDAAIERLNKQNALKEAERKLSGDESLPIVSSIIIDHNGPSARITYASGLMRTIREGDLVGNGMKVTSITSNGVKVSRNRSVSYLPFQSLYNQTQASNQGVLPPMPR